MNLDIQPNGPDFYQVTVSCLQFHGKRISLGIPRDTPIHEVVERMKKMRGMPPEKKL